MNSLDWLAGFWIVYLLFLTFSSLKVLKAREEELLSLQNVQLFTIMLGLQNNKLFH